MADERFPSDTADRFQLRMPDGMRDRIKEAAAKSGRSMNAEIIHRLEHSLYYSDAAEKGSSVDVMFKAVDELKETINRLIDAKLQERLK